MNKEEALKFYSEKHSDPVKVVREFVHRKTGVSLFVINDNYAVRVIIPESFNCCLRNQNFKSRISGCKISKQDLNDLLIDKYHTHKLFSTWVNC